MYWDQDTILEFIELIKNEPAIWNVKAKNHNNRTALNEAWQRVASSFSLSLPVDDLKRKRNSLTTLYRAYVKRIHESARHNTNGEDLYQPTWYAFDAMHSFMAPFYGFEDNGNIKLETANLLAFEATEHHETDEESEHESAKSASKEYTERSVKRRRPSPRDPLTVAKPSECNLQTDYQFISTEADETDLFAQILVRKLRKMNKQDRLMATHEINNIVFKYEMKGLELNRDERRGDENDE